LTASTILTRRTLIIFCTALAGMLVLASLRPAARAQAPLASDPPEATRAMTEPDAPAPLASDAPATTQATTEPDADATVEVVRGTIDLRLELSAVFTPVDPFEARVRPRAYEGDLEIIRAVAAGVPVVKGDVLVEFEAKDARRQLAQAGTAEQLAQANLAKAQADVEQGARADALALKIAEDGVRYAEGDLTWWDDIDTKIVLGSADVNEQMTAFQVDSSAEELEQLKKMYKSEDLTNETADIVLKRATRTLELYRSMQSVDKLQLKKLRDLNVGRMREQVARALDASKQSLDQVEVQLAQQGAARKAALDEAKVVLDVASEKVTDLKADLELFTVRSGVDGVVVYGSFKDEAWQPMTDAQLKPGEKINAGDVLMTIFAPTKMHALAMVSEAVKTRLDVGTRARLMPTLMPGQQYDAIVASVATIGEAKGETGQSFDVVMTLSPVDGRIAPGYTADVVIDGGRVDNVLIVPKSALRTGRVWVRDAEENDQARDVVVGQSDDEHVEIKSGLVEGDVVLKEAKK